MVNFLSDPSCAGAYKTDCGARAEVKETVPECSQALEVKAVVKPLMYIYDSSSNTWKEDVNYPLDVRTGSATFVVVPSVKQGDNYRGARFSFHRANQSVANQFNQYLQGRSLNEATVGLPL